MNISSTDKDYACNISEYWSEGYTVLRSAISESNLTEIRREIDRLWDAPGIVDDLNIRSESRRDATGTWVMDRLDPVLDLSPTLAKAAASEFVLKAVSKVLRGASQLLKCKIIKKHPGTGGYSHHQDFLYWKWLDIPADHLCSAAIAIYPATKDSGGIEIFPKYHRELIASKSGNSNEDFDIDLIDDSTGVIPHIDAGDILLFHSLAPHRSGLNKASTPRTVLLPSYAVSDDSGLYQKYYEYEIKRRCSQFVGFERLNYIKNF